MFEQPLISIKRSISTQILVLVFSIYFLIAFLVTATHMLAEYYNAKGNILQTLELFKNSVERSLSTAIWDMNTKQITSTLTGLTEIPLILGVKIEMIDDGNTIGNGYIRDKAGKIVLLKNNEEAIKTSQTESEIPELFEYNFFIKHGTHGQIAKGTLYSSTDQVWKLVKNGFIFILINAVIKSFALWAIFIAVSRRKLQFPLARFTEATKKLNFDSLESAMVDVKTKGENELKVLETAFNLMIEKLILAKNRSISLRIISNKVTEFTQTHQIFRFAFNELRSYLPCDHAILIIPADNQDELKLIQQGPESVFLKHLPTPQLLERIFLEEGQETVMINHLDEHSPLYEHYFSQSDAPKVKCHFLWTRVDTLPGYLICLFRHASSRPFESADFEYLKSMMNEVKISQASIKLIEQKLKSR